MTAATDTLRLVDGAALADLGRFASRARALDADGAMRLQAGGGVLAAWVGVLQGSGILAEGTVLGLRTFELAEPATLDAVVPLGAVTDRTARAAATSTELDVPPTRALAAWAAVTPPRGPWEPAGDLPGDLLATVAREGLAEVADAVKERGAAAGFVRDRVWARDVRDTSGPHPDLLEGEAVPSGVTVRAGGAFAAYALGFLAPGEPVRVLRSNRWTRLTAAGGHVLMR